MRRAPSLSLLSGRRVGCPPQRCAGLPPPPAACWVSMGARRPAPAALAGPRLSGGRMTATRGRVLSMLTPHTASPVKMKMKVMNVRHLHDEQQVPNSVTKEELQRRLGELEDRRGREGLVLLDVRQPYELDALPAIHHSARLLPLQELPRALELSEDDWEDAYGFEKPQLDDEVVCYCKSGMRSEMACALLRQRGYTRVRNYRGSALDWWAASSPS